MTIRQATPDDLPFLAVMLVEAAYPLWADPKRTPAAALVDPVAGRYLRDWGRHGDGGVIAMLAGRPIGAAWFRLFPVDEPGHGFLAADIPELAIAVDASARSAGIGTQLLAALVECARQQGRPSLSLAVSAANPVAQRLYARAGFVRAGGDDDHPILRRDIDPASPSVAAVTGRVERLSPGSRRIATFVDGAERVVVAFETPRWGPVIVKTSSDPKVFERERRALEVARSAGVPVAAIQYAETGQPWALVLECLDGLSLGPAAPSTAWRAAGAALRALHAAPTSHLPQFGDGRPWPVWLHDWIGIEVAAAVAGGVVDASSGEGVSRYLDATVRTSNATSLIHGDCAAEHFLVLGDEVVGVIDFGDAGLGDPIYDVVVLTLWQPDRLEDVLVGYRADSAFRGRVASLYRPFALLRYLAASRWLHERGFDASRHDAWIRQEATQLLA